MNETCRLGVTRVGTRKKTTYGGRAPMPLDERAKIFAPFDPLDGFRDALRAKEREVEKRHMAKPHESLDVAD